MKNEKKPFDLVCEGGGVRGIALVGALEVLEEAGYEAHYRAGTSAGAIVATLHAAGYRAAELREIMAETRFSRFIDTGLLDRIPVVGPPLGILYEHGVFEGDEFYRWLSQECDPPTNRHPQGYWPDSIQADTESLSVNPSFPEDQSGRAAIPWL